MSETPQPTPEGIDRTPTGEIKDQSAPPTTETKTEQQAQPGSTTPPKEAKPAEGESLLTKDDDAKPAVGAPEKYEFKAPEGFVITDEAAKDLSALFKESNLSQAQAQKFIDYVAPQLMEAVEAPFKAYQETRQEWQKQITDKYGSKLPEVKATIGRALDGLGNPTLVSAFREAMDTTGAGDNPAVWDAIYELAQRVSEGTHVKSGGPSKFGQSANPSRPLSAAQAMYPHLPSSAG